MLLLRIQLLKNLIKFDNMSNFLNMYKYIQRTIQFCHILYIGVLNIDKYSLSLLCIKGVNLDFKHLKYHDLSGNKPVFIEKQLLSYKLAF